MVHLIARVGCIRQCWPNLTYVHHFCRVYSFLLFKRLLKPSISTTFLIFNWETYKMNLYQIESRRKEGDPYNMGRVTGCHWRNTFQCMPFEQVAKNWQKLSLRTFIASKDWKINHFHATYYFTPLMAIDFLYRLHCIILLVCLW